MLNFADMKKLITYSILILLLSFGLVDAKKIHPGFYAHQTVKSRQLAEGVVYKHIYIGQRAKKHSVRVVECDLTKSDVMPGVMKAGMNNSTTEKIQSMIAAFDSVSGNRMLAAVNANFWRAYSLYPIGPTVIDGQIVEKYRYKKWSSLFLDSLGTPYIDTFDISVHLIGNGDTIDIHRVNRRYDTTVACMYNSFYGDSLPRVLGRDIDEIYQIALEKALLDINFADSTEEEFDSLKLKNRLINEKREENFEYSCLKITLEYLGKPAINAETECIVTGIASGAVAVPDSGCVISIPADSATEVNFKIGDILTLKQSTNRNKEIKFFNSVCGTPRLVRDGNPTHEAYKEGSSGRRFIHYRLPRTACGYNKDKSKFYLVICDPNSSSLGRKAANLSDMAAIMKSLGCYDAVNLDGGGSSYMVIGGENVTYPSNPGRGRKVSVSLGVFFKNL